MRQNPQRQNLEMTCIKENLFETIWSRKKFDILGKKRKGEERHVGLARSRAIEKRKKTILKEYAQSVKSSVFVDKRIGENNDILGEFGKALMRTQRERMVKLSRRSKYNLSDEDKDHEMNGLDFFLGKDDFNEEVQPESGDDDHAENREHKAERVMLEQLNKGASYASFESGISSENHRPKSKKEVMGEIILKSKMFKAQKAKDKEENEKFIEQLDKNFTALADSASFLALTLQNKIDKKAEKGDVYDELVGKMALEVRACPSDRTKTPEEIAQEERERLEHLEEERKRRMLATDDSSDENTDEGTLEKGHRMISGDDLGDFFEEPKAKKGWIDEILEGQHSENRSSDSEDGEEGEEGEDRGLEGPNDGCDGSDVSTENTGSEKIMSLKDWEQSSDDYNTDVEEEGLVYEDEDKKLLGMELVHNTYNDVYDVISEQGKLGFPHTKDTCMEKLSSSMTESLPFVINTPCYLDEFSALVDSRSNAEILEAISRIRKSNAIILGPENKRKIQVFYGVLLQFFAVSASKSPLNAGLLNLLVRPLIEMSFEIPYFAAICARERLLRIRSKFWEDIRIFGKHYWPSLKVLMLLQLWCLIFPCSDFRHVVMTPALLFMSECLMTCPVVTGRDVAVGSFLCSMILSVTKQSKKFCPEAVVFIHNLFAAATERTQCDIKLGQIRPAFSLRISSCVCDVSSLDFFQLMDSPDDSPLFTCDNFRANVLFTAIETLHGFVLAYVEHSSFPEIFLQTPHLLLEICDQALVPSLLQRKLKETAQLITDKAHHHHSTRRHLQMRKQNPVPIKMLNPKFEENFVMGRDYDPDRERSERRKLKKRLKREAQGAVRELRKDNYFLLEARERDKALLREERLEKYGKARAFLQEQEHAFKSGQLGRGRKRRQR